MGHGHALPSFVAKDEPLIIPPQVMQVLVLEEAVRVHPALQDCKAGTMPLLEVSQCQGDASAKVAQAAPSQGDASGKQSLYNELSRSAGSTSVTAHEKRQQAFEGFRELHGY